MHVRCQFIDSAGLQCETWYQAAEMGLEKFCPNCRSLVGPNSSMQNGTKETMIARVNEIQAICALMTLDELDAHISGIEKRIEEQRTELLASRATRAQKIEALSDEERDKRRAIKTPREIKSKPEKLTIKNNPIRYMMQQYNVDETTAKKLLGLS